MKAKVNELILTNISCPFDCKEEECKKGKVVSQIHGFETVFCPEFYNVISYKKLENVDETKVIKKKRSS